jgi:hypothetical protein
VPLVIFTVVPASEHEPVATTVTGNPELADALIVNIVLYTADVGAPVSVIVWFEVSAVTSSTTGVAGL